MMMQDKLPISLNLKLVLPRATILLHIRTAVLKIAAPFVNQQCNRTFSKHQ